MEHVDKRSKLLERVKLSLAPKGDVFASVRKGRFIQWQAGAILGILPNELPMTKLDGDHRHRRVYDSECSRGEFIGPGCKVHFFAGFLPKSLEQG